MRSALGEVKSQRRPAPMPAPVRSGTLVLEVSMTRKRVLLLAVAVLLSLSAFLAIAILLVGRFGSVEGRILGSTALLAGYGLVALPAVVLLDKERSGLLALAAAALVALAACLGMTSVWSQSDSDVLGRTVGSATIVALAFAQLATATAWRSERDPVAVRRLFAVSCGTGALVAAFAVALLWSGPHGGVVRFLGALVVLDLLLVALQPILARARPTSTVRRFTIVTASGERIEVEIAGADLASAAAQEGEAGATEDTGAAWTPDDTEFNVFNTDRRLEALRSIAAALSHVEQKKSLIYISSGMDRTGVENQSELRAAVNAAVRANLSIYTMDIRGLQALVPGGEAQSASLRGVSAYSGASTMNALNSNFTSQETLVTLAGDTGGRAYLDSNDFSKVFAGVQQDTSTYYMPGYHSTNLARDGRYRRGGGSRELVDGKGGTCAKPPATTDPPAGPQYCVPSGTGVLTIRPGIYWISVDDPLNSHNFELRSCPGSTSPCSDTNPDAISEQQITDIATIYTDPVTIKVNLKPGWYRLFCDATVPVIHEPRGMYIDIEVGGAGQVD